MKNEKQFRVFLCDKKTSKAINSRIRYLREIEKLFNEEIDNIVLNDDKMFGTLCRIKKLGDHNGNKQNALRLYYLFINDKEFPLLKDYPSLITRFHICYKNNVSVKTFCKDLATINDAIKETINEKNAEKKIKVNDNNIKLTKIDSGSIWAEIAVFLAEVIGAYALEKLFDKLLDRFKKKKKYRLSLDQEGNIIIEEL